MNLKQQYQRYLLSDSFVQAQQHVTNESKHTLDESLALLERDQIQSEWVSYYYIASFQLSDERHIRQILITCSQVKYVEFDHDTQHVAIFHDGEWQNITSLLASNSRIEYQQTLAQFVPVHTTFQPVIRAAQFLPWLTAIYLVVCLVTICIAILASSFSLMMAALFVLIDATIYFVANNLTFAPAWKKTRCLISLAWIELAISCAALIFIFYCSRHITALPLASFIILQGVILAIAAIVARFFIIKTFLNKPVYWGHLFKHLDVYLALALIFTGILVQFTTQAWPDWIMAIAMLSLIWLRLLDILYINRLALKFNK